ncbi:hypothetical protein MMC25_003639 [Agyrium rufum]|nr:hypothetical protein [Agyrium rufum]
MADTTPQPPIALEQRETDANVSVANPDPDTQVTAPKVDKEETPSSDFELGEKETRMSSSSSPIPEPVIKDLEKNAGIDIIHSVVDPNMVTFDGIDDPENAMSWSARKKWSNVAALSYMTLITPLASSMFAPGVPQVLADFHSNSQVLESFVVSVYLLGYAAGPLIIGPLSEMYGRTPLYHSTNVLFVIFTVACALATNLNMLIGFRFLAGSAGSAVLTLGGGSVGDMFIQEQRGKAMALWSMGPLMGPVIGPIAGGFLNQAAGWRWIFWVITIAGGVGTALCLLVLRETFPVILLERKAARLRKETGNEQLRSKLSSGLTPKELFKRSIVRPLKMLCLSPIVFGLSLHMAIVYGYLYLLFTTITEVFEINYRFSSGTVGLTFLGIGIGMFLGLFLAGAMSDKIVTRMAKGGEMKPEYRLPMMIPGAVVIPMGLFIYGWTAEKHVFWIAPIIGTALVGLGLIITFMPITTYLVDAFTINAASALAANTVLRSAVGALLPLAGQPMYQALGLGWGNSLLGFVALAMCPVPWLFYKYGETLRTHPRFYVNF